MFKNNILIIGSLLFLASIAVSSMFVSGCASNANWQAFMKERGGGYKSPEEKREEEETHRTDYQENRSSEAMLWLLTNRVKQGMSVEDVNIILGQEGGLEKNAGWIRNKSPLYRRDDVTYRYGPDDEGRTIYLMFREGNLVNFDPEEYEK